MGALRPVGRMGQRLDLLLRMGADMMDRYKLEIVNNHGDRYIRCEPAPDGSWVMFRDVAALQARVAKLETALQFIKDAPDEERKPNWNNMGSYEAGLRYCAAFANAALEGKKDE